jgi:hypothetical protein
MISRELSPDSAVWQNAPRERTAAYFPTYSSISRALQAALREWTREWFYANPAVLSRFSTAYQILVYFSTTPFRGRPTNFFTYDVQRTELIQEAMLSAASKMKRALERLDTSKLPWAIRERYFPYRYQEVIRFVKRNHQVLYQMLNADTKLMDATLWFALHDVRELSLDHAGAKLRSRFHQQLTRFSSEFDLTGRGDDLLRIATEQLAQALQLGKVASV